MQSDRFVIYHSFKNANSYIFARWINLGFDKGKVYFSRECDCILSVYRTIYYFVENFYGKKAIMGNGHNSLLYLILCHQLDFFIARRFKLDYSWSQFWKVCKCFVLLPHIMLLEEKTNFLRGGTTFDRNQISDITFQKVHLKEN